jgi:hypothetical protein
MSWETSLARAGLKSLIPTEDYFSSDLTEASIMIGFWIREGVIVPMEEYDLIANAELFWE